LRTAGPGAGRRRAGRFGQQPAFEGGGGGPATARRVPCTAAARQSKPWRMPGSIAAPWSVSSSAHAAVEQCYAKKRFQRLDLLADGGERFATPSGRRVWARA
jgi:hypothetical protein